MSTPCKTCTCCGRRFTREEWVALPLPSGCVREPEKYPDGIKVDEFSKEQYRNCACGSTLVVTLESYEVTP